MSPTRCDLSGPMKDSFAKYVNSIESGEYPAAEHQYEMPADERKKFEAK